MSRKDVNSSELKTKVDKLIEKFLGFAEPRLASTALACVSAGYDKKRIIEKFGALLDKTKAERLAEKVLNLNGDSIKSSSRKRHHNESENGEAKKVKSEEKKEDSLTQNEIQDLMANAQKMIEERKKALQEALNKTASAPPPAPNNATAAAAAARAVAASIAAKTGTAKTPVLSTPPVSASVQKPPVLSDEKSRKIAMLQAQIKSKLSSGLLNLESAGAAAAIDKPTPLILDSEGRTVDSSGKEVQLTHVVPTLKANIRAKKREEFKAQLLEKPQEESSEAKFYDPRISLRPNIRNRKSLRFHEPGKFQQMADRMRMKAQLEKLQGEISQIAKKTGITSATKLALIAPKVEKGKEKVPDVEWWDMVVLQDNSYGPPGENPLIKTDAITFLIEHPIQMKAPTIQNKPVYMPVFLTKKERKKLRRQNRREAWKEEQEKIRLGLEPPPEPKLRISNLMRALGTEAVQDPTKMEAHVKAQMAKRLKAHQDANAARKLTVAQRREKRRRKLAEDLTYGVHVTVFRVKDLSNMTKKFKVETNCKQLTMTGAVIMYKNCNIIIVEGGPKQSSIYKRLLLNRIKWEEDSVKDADGKETPNNCALVWEGMTLQRNFGEMKFKICATEVLAREQLRKHNCEHYWDLAYSGSILEAEEK